MQRGEKTPKLPRGKAGQIGGARERGEHACIAQICGAGVRGPGREAIGERGEMRGIHRRDVRRSHARWRRISHRARAAGFANRYTGGR